MSKSFASLYRPCVGIALFNRDGLVFVGERLDSPGAWQMPQGGIDHGESVQDAAFRELREEIGTNRAGIIAVMPEKLRYDLPPDLQGKLWGGKYLGQEQSWIAMRFTGEDADIDLTAHSVQEFSRWRWVSLERVPDLIVPFKQETYRAVVRAFAGLGASSI
jgi:putative (di)nucleoside polyphosphate hydrolase